MGPPGAVALVERTRSLGSPAEEADLWEGAGTYLSALDGRGITVAPTDAGLTSQQDGLAAYHYSLALLQTGKHAQAKGKTGQALRTNGDRRRPILLALAMCQAARADWRELPEAG